MSAASLFEKVVRCNETKIAGELRRISTGNVLNSPFLLEVCQSLEEAAFTEVYLVMLPVMGSAVSPVRLKRAELIAAILEVR
jgi:hypothetical protein